MEKEIWDVGSSGTRVGNGGMGLWEERGSEEVACAEEDQVN